MHSTNGIGTTGRRCLARATAMGCALLVVCASTAACDGDGDGGNGDEYQCMTGATADCEFDTLTFTIAGGASREIGINGLAVHEMWGANKLGPDTVEVVTRRGVRFSDILDRAGITGMEDAPVNCVARDGWDPLRARLDGDTSALPTLAFMRASAYVWVGDAGEGDPLYPDMEGRTLIVDYDLETDAEVPASLGGALTALGMFRFKMVEKVDDAQRGVFEIDPVP